MEFRYVAPSAGAPPQDVPAPLPAIQILRAVAALAIALLHTLHDADILSRRLGGEVGLQRMLPLDAGVDLFFVISGFVMVYASRDMFGRASSIGPFLRRRIARIAPIYWAATAVYLAIAFSGFAPLNRPQPDGWEIAASFLFLPWLLGSGPLVQPVYTLGWTLNYEMLFYLMFALVLPLKREKAVPLLVGVLMLLVAAGQFVPSTQVQLHFWTRSIILEFAFGMIIGQMAVAGVRPGKGMAAALVVAALAMLWIGHVRPGLFPDRALQYGLPAALLVIAALAFNDIDATRPLSRLFMRLGDASYAIYLLHPFVIRGVAVAAGLMLARISPWLYVTACLALTCLVAWAAWRWFERPVTKALQGSRRD
jgi:exopolysaccharide production protein ExoZ